MIVEDIVVNKPKINALKISSTAEEWRALAKHVGEERYAVTDEWNRVIGIVNLKDIECLTEGQSIEKVLIRNPITTSLQTSLASAAQLMMWEGIDFLPVVDRNRKLITTIRRKEVLQAMRDAQQHSQLGETFDQLIWNGIAEERDQEGRLYFHGFITPQMATDLGTISEGVLATVMTQAAFKYTKDISGNDYVLDNMSTYFLRPVQIEDQIVIASKLLELSRRTCKIEIEMSHDDTLVCKGVMTLQSIEHG